MRHPIPWPAAGPAALACGNTFDAVRVAEHHARAVISRLEAFGLGRRVGAVLAHHDQVYFFVPPARDDAEPWPDLVRYCGAGSFVTVPPRHHTHRGPGGLRWLKVPVLSDEPCLSEPLILRTALEVLRTHLRPRDEPSTPHLKGSPPPGPRGRSTPDGTMRLTPLVDT
ncbi:hypothetical protein FNQ90_05195 [Streptomyces alkaliphilus]|uniref:DNA primase/polymerase bifunctional N-terminal domain-containing protein n=1 Tax=Streptomyces alkaliphilus TaxID=1472722 RepID=A0A7W3Y0D6_9ACTN|nr:hypothetical protein [Streptomyces alkaliphilus]MBB0243519.1 hypothetical protein [Streptomyces alkaliphilus]